MTSNAFFILAISSSLASSQLNDDLEVCWRESYGRGVGTVLDYCKEGYEHQGALCYPFCAANYTGVGPVCWENCPPGWTDIGALCTIPVDIYFPCPWYDICGLTFAKGCKIDCRPGYHDDGCSCRRPTQTMAKKSYGRGAGDIPGCKPPAQEDAGLCYDPCRDSFKGVGPVCWKEGSGNSTAYGVQCNPVSYGHTQTDCDNLNQFLKQAGITSVMCIGSVAASIAAGHVVGPKVCRDLITKVLPTLIKTPIC